MTISSERFAAIVEAYGSDPARWPTEERTAATIHCATHPEAQALLAEFLEGHDPRPRRSTQYASNNFPHNPAQREPAERALADFTAAYGVCRGGFVWEESEVEGGCGCWRWAAVWYGCVGMGMGVDVGVGA